MTTTAETSVEVSQRAIAGLTAFVHELRPGWDQPGIAATIRQLLGRQIPVASVAFALVKAALDTTNTTPAALLHMNNHAWTDDDFPECPRHPGYRGVREPTGQCGHCWADAHAATDPTPPAFTRRPPTPQARAAIAQLKARPKRHTRPGPDTGA